MKKGLRIAIVAFLCGGSLGYTQEVYDAQRIAEIFKQLNGDLQRPKQKVNHAQGFCASGSFIPEKDIVSLVDVPMLAEGALSAELRYSLGGAMMSDKSKTRGLALKLQGKDEVWTMVMLGTEINFARTPEEFGQFFEMRLPVNGKVDQEKIKRLMQEVDSYRRFAEYTAMMGITPSVAHTAYFSIHTFYFKDKESGKMISARWKFVPTEGVKYFSEEELKKAKNIFLEEDFKVRIKKAPIVYQMYLVYANEGDSVNDTTALWSGKHREVLVGTLRVDGYQEKQCDGAVYFPSELPQGVGAPQDPLFDLRNEVYGITFGFRQ